MTTPQPVYCTTPTRAVPPAQMLYEEKVRYRTAAYLATRLYPGAIGKLLAADLLAMEEFGCRIGADSLMWQVCEQVLAESRKRADARPA